MRWTTMHGSSDGTSASAPVFAGVVALMNQYLGGSSAQGLGNVNPMLYQLAVSNPTAFPKYPATSDNNEHLPAKSARPPVRIQRCNARHRV